MPKDLNVTFFLAEQMLATSLALPLEQLRAAESMAMTAKRRDSQRLNIQLASLDGNPVKTHTGLTLTPDCKLEEITHSDITFLPALWRNPGKTLAKNADAVPWFKQQHHTGGRLAGVGTGCCFLAEGGLLDFRMATTHWYYFEQFRKKYPKVRLEKNHFITGQDNLYCTASVNALADLTVFFIQEIFGSYYARHVERHFFHEVRKAFSFAHYINGETQAHPDEEIARAQSWMRQNFEKNIIIFELANRLNMSLRTFNRRFKKATNETPLNYLRSVRMQAAGDLLHSSNLAVTEISERCGIQDVSHFTGLFKKHFGATPTQYRTTVRAKLFTPE